MLKFYVFYGSDRSISRQSFVRQCVYYESYAASYQLSWVDALNER